MSARWPIASWRTMVAYDIAVVLKWPRRFPRIRVQCCECACISTSGPSSGKDAADAGGYPEAWPTIPRHWWVMTFLTRRDRRMREMRGPRWGYWLSSALPRDLRAAAVATHDFFFRPFKGRLSLIILRIYKILSSAYANDTYVHPASDKCAICANAPVEVRCPLRFLTSLLDSDYHLFLMTSLTMMTSTVPSLP